MILSVKSEMLNKDDNWMGNAQHRVSQQIGEAVQDSSMWRLVCKELVDLFDANNAFLTLATVHETEPIFSSSHPISIRDIKEYWGKYQSVDIWYEKIRHLEQGNAVIGSELIPTEKLRESNFYTQYLTHLKMDKLLHISIINNKDYHCFLGLTRSKSENDFTIADKEALQQLGPQLHVGMMGYIGLRNSQASQHFINNEWLGSYSFALFLLNEDSNIIYMNDYASHLIDDSSYLAIVDKKLTYTENNERANKLQEFLTRVSDRKPKNGIIQKLATMQIGDDYLRLVAVKYNKLSRLVPRLDKKHQPTCLVILQDRNLVTQELDVSYLVEAFSLTSAEIRVVDCIIQGYSPQEISDYDKKSINTVRTQLKSIFGKTNTNNQQSLLRLLINEAMYQVPNSNDVTLEFESLHNLAAHEVI